MPEAEGVEAAPALREQRSAPPGPTAKVDQAGLLGEKRPPKARQALGQHLEHPPCVLFPVEGQQRIIAKSDHEGLSVQTRIDLLLVPPVEHLMQLDIRHQGADHASLRAAQLGTMEHPLIHDPDLHPFAQRATDHDVTHPLVEKGIKAGSSHAVDEGMDVEADQPATPQVHDPVPQRLLGTTARAKAEGAVQEDLLVDRLQCHQHRALKDLFLQRRNTDRPRLLRSIVGDVHAIHSHRTVRAGPPIRLFQPHAETIALQSSEYVGSVGLSYGSLSHGLQAPRMRFAGGIAPAPRNTRFQWTANPYRLGTCTQRGAKWGTRFAYRFAILRFFSQRSSVRLRP